MSGIETLLASAFSGLTTAGTTTAATAGVTAAEVAAIAGGTAEALAGGGIVSGFAPAAAAGSTLGLVSAGASLAGAGAQLLSGEPTKIDLPKAPTRDDARLEAERRSAILKRRGRAATILTSPQGVASSPTLGSPSLLGSG